MATTSIPISQLFAADHNGRCPNPRPSTCEAAVTLHEGRYYITGFHPNFNSRANNGNGYATEAGARAAIKNREAR